MKRIMIFLLTVNIIFAASKFKEVDEVVQAAIDNHVFPGACVSIGTSDSILYNKAYGQFTYDASSTVVDTLSIFDLASLTKVFATSMCMMKCIDSGLVSPEDYVKDYVPAFDNNGKGSIKVKHLLMHTSGLPAYTSPASTRSATLNNIYNISQSNSIGTYTYSCLNFIMNMRVVEEATGMMMWEFYKEIYTDPMGLVNSMFCPEDSLHDRCLPTTRSLQGSVHDPLAAGLNGYSGNAGLFSTSGDLAKFCQLMLGHGTVDGRKYVDSTTVVPFTTLQSTAGSRAYGWGINGSSAGSLMSDLNFGHTGYTGTSAFMDPTRDLFVVLLTNRVYPDDNASVSSTRQAVANAAVRVIDDLPGQPRIHSILPNSDGSWDLNWNYKNNIDSVKLVEQFDGGSNGGNEFIYPADSLTIKLYGIDCICQRSVKLIPYYNGNEGDPSDTYFVKRSTQDKVVLIVDGYDRVSNDQGWNLAYHYISGYYADALPEGWGYTTCDNQAIIDEDVLLNDYEHVIWFSGDESVSDETFSSVEQNKVKAYLEQGGHFFVSGSEIGYDIGNKGSSADISFYNNYFKAIYVGDDSNDYTVTGRENTRFEGLSFSYGGSSALYPEDYPDKIRANGGGKFIVQYSSGVYAGIGYVGPFGTSSDTGKVICLGFPFETIQGEDKRIDFMARIIDFFESANEVSVEDIFGDFPTDFHLRSAYPNPFNPSTTLEFTIPYDAEVKLNIFNINGQQITTLANDHYSAGSYAINWNAANYPSGIYFANLSVGGESKVQKLILMK